MKVDIKFSNTSRIGRRDGIAITRDYSVDGDEKDTNYGFYLSLIYFQRENHNNEILQILFDEDEMVDVERFRDSSISDFIEEFESNLKSFITEEHKEKYGCNIFKVEGKCEDEFVKIIKDFVIKELIDLGIKM